MDVSFWEQTVRYGPLAAWAKSSRPLFQLEPTPSSCGCGSLGGARCPLHQVSCMGVVIIPVFNQAKNYKA